MLNCSSSARFSVGSGLLSECSEDSWDSGDKNGLPSKKKFPIELLINFLSEFKDSLGSSSQAGAAMMARFEQLVVHTLTTAHDKDLNALMRQHGWIGKKFSVSEVIFV